MELEITPASLAHVTKGRGGHFVTVEQDVLDVAKQLKEIHPEFRLQYNEAGGYFRVVQETPGYRAHTVTTALEADQRLVNRMRALVADPQANAAAGEAHDAQVDRDIDARLAAAAGEGAERLAHAIRMDLRQGKPGPVYMPPDIYTTSRSYRKKGR